MSNQKHLYQVTHAIAEKWAGNAESEISAMVDKILTDKLEEFVMRVLGFEVEYMATGRSNPQKWRIDHCNNRSGNSPIGNFLNNKVEQRISELAGKIELTSSEKSEINKIARDEYLKKYKWAILQSVGRQAEDDARSYAKTTIISALEGSAESIRLQLMETA